VAGLLLGRLVDQGGVYGQFGLTCCYGGGHGALQHDEVVLFGYVVRLDGLDELDDGVEEVSVLNVGVGGGQVLVDLVLGICDGQH
jgi:hypothetical protein